MKKTVAIPRKWLDKNFYSMEQQKQIVDKMLFALLVGVALAMFGHSLLSVLTHLLHILIEIIESIVEHLLEWMFNLSPRQAEIMTFWLGFALLAGVARPISRKTYAALKNNYINWLIKPKSDKSVWLIQFLLIGTILTLFT